jgi:hypothetical protein
LRKLLSGGARKRSPSPKKYKEPVVPAAAQAEQNAAVEKAQAE